MTGTKNGLQNDVHMARYQGRQLTSRMYFLNGGGYAPIQPSLWPDAASRPKLMPPGYMGLPSNVQMSIWNTQLKGTQIPYGTPANQIAIGDLTTTNQLAERYTSNDPRISGPGTLLNFEVDVPAYQRDVFYVQPANNQAPFPVGGLY